MAVYTGGPADPDTLSAAQRKRRDQIVHVALRGLASGEYENIKVADVAKQSGVALATLYRYFASKEHLFAVALLAWQDALRRNMRGISTTERAEDEAVRDLLHRTIRAFELQPQFFRAVTMLESAPDPYTRQALNQFGRGFADIFETTIGQELDADRSAIYYTLLAVVSTALRDWLAGRFTIDQMYRQVDDSIRLIYRTSPDREPASRSR
jgi:AcrR family transcriptional regulator